MYHFVAQTLENLDWGGLLSLIVTIIIMFALRVHSEVYRKIKESERLWALVIIVLAIIGLTASWLTVRTVALMFKNYLFIEGYIYSTENIFIMVSSILTANLCFTLLRAFAMIGRKGDARPEENPESKEPSEKKDAVEELINVAIQAVIIAFITFIPNYRAETSQEMSSTAPYYLFVTTAMIGSLVALLYMKYQFSKRSGSARTHVI